jgi:hypothetical protein
MVKENSDVINRLLWGCAESYKSEPLWGEAVRALYVYEENAVPTSFYSLLFNLIFASNTAQRRKLAVAFPHAFIAWCEWYGMKDKRDFFKNYKDFLGDRKE